MHLAGKKIRAWREAHNPPLTAEQFGVLYGAQDGVPKRWPSRTVYGWEVKGKIARAAVQKRLAELGICAAQDWLAGASEKADDLSGGANAAGHGAIGSLRGFTAGDGLRDGVIESAHDVIGGNRLRDGAIESAHDVTGGNRLRDGASIDGSSNRGDLNSGGQFSGISKIKGGSERDEGMASHPFFEPHSHGFIRVATSTPKVRTADISYNRDAILSEARRAHAAEVDLVIFPELCVSSYAIDDLHMQHALLDAVEAAIVDIVAESAALAPVLLIGAPLRRAGKIFNCALAVSHGRILGVIPKSYLPNYREYYEKRWFAHGRNIRGQNISVAGRSVPFGVDLLFCAQNLPSFTFFTEICEDFWSPNPPSTLGALAGAVILANLSASNVTIGKSDERHLLARAQSSRAIAAYAYSASGHGESTTDLSWDGQGMIYEMGDLLAESERFSLAAELAIADVDTDRILAERMRNQTFTDAGEAEGQPEAHFRKVMFRHAGVNGGGFKGADGIGADVAGADVAGAGDVGAGEYASGPAVAGSGVAGSGVNAGGRMGGGAGALGVSMDSGASSAEGAADASGAEGAFGADEGGYYSAEGADVIDVRAGEEAGANASEDLGADTGADAGSNAGEEAGDVGGGSAFAQGTIPRKIAPESAALGSGRTPVLNKTASDMSPSISSENPLANAPDSGRNISPESAPESTQENAPESASQNAPQNEIGGSPTNTPPNSPPNSPQHPVVKLYRPIRRFPFVPARAHRLDADCYEGFNIQIDGLMRRISATKAQSMVIGVSGGLDSTHALIIAAKTCDKMGLPRGFIRGFTMPGFGTSDHTKGNAWKLMEAMGITAEEIDIVPAATKMLADIGHPFADGEPQYDVTFENVQAGLRSDYLFRLAGQHNGFVIGTGDLSELALGWCTYGVGDQMSHYGVNAGVPKTLIQYLIRWAAQGEQFDTETNAILHAILDTEISPELVPADAGGAIQSTEAKIGPYELNDFFLHHIIRWGQRPSKVAFLAYHAWHNAGEGVWPAHFPDAKKNQYDLDTIRAWLEKFLQRFFGFSQFKRSAMPNGPKVSSGGALSPRGDWRAPSDSVADLWLEELRTKVPGGVGARNDAG